MTEPLDKDLDDILEAAANWHVRLDLGTADEAAFERWRDADPRHAAAFARMVGTDAAVRMEKDNIPGEVDEFEVERSQPNRRQWLIGALTGVGACGVAVGGFVMFSTRRAHAETPVGGKADLAMSDGGQVTINTNSRVSWRFDKRVREIWLERGEMALSMPVEERPWRIHADGHTISGQGGKLNVRLRGKGVEVTLLDGPTVVVAGEGTGVGGVITLTPGQSLRAGEGSAPVKLLSPEDLQVVTAWQSDEMVFTGQTLSSVVEEYNRYLERKIVVQDPALANIRLGGRFNIKDMPAFLDALKSSFGIQSSVQGDTIVLTK